ncbi:serine protease AprX [Bacillus sp. OV194]|nr:serine protease AprX [Bacillus sp. OV194]
MSAGKYEGVAPGADLIGYGSGAVLFIFDGIGGFDYAITHQSKYGIRVITNSWGSSGDFQPEDPINVASKAAYDRGITVLFAAGNEGPGEDTHNPYAKAPWVISVAAGDKSGKLADFSSRGVKGKGGTFVQGDKTWTWKDQPTITAPGVDIISTRVIAPVSSLGAPDDAELIKPAYLPYYTTMSGTSMATPHVAGVVALLLDANPSLSPDEVKNILEKTATNMPGLEIWEAGAGYVNAYAAVDMALHNIAYGKTVNSSRTFNSKVEQKFIRRCCSTLVCTGGSDHHPQMYG